MDVKWKNAYHSSELWVWLNLTEHEEQLEGLMSWEEDLAVTSSLVGRLRLLDQKLVETRVMILKLALYVFDHECIVQDENEEKGEDYNDTVENVLGKTDEAQ